jgi:medium-chain acyl-[acyl-carrier-protein] hydrolase
VTPLVSEYPLEIPYKGIIDMSQQTSWLPPVRTDARQRLFCFPYAGGGASIYREWAKQLPADVEVCPIQLPGRENRIVERPFTSLEPLIQTLAEVLRPYLDLPFSFFGHSLGSLVSFELTRYLRRHSLPQPRRLLLSAHRAPQLTDRGKPIHALPDAEFIDALKTLGGTPEEVLRHAELMELLLPTLRADFTIYETYHYQPEAPLACPFTVFGGEDDREVSVPELEAWRLQTTGEFRLRMFPGAHFYIHSHQKLLLQNVARVIILDANL